MRTLPILLALLALSLAVPLEPALANHPGSRTDVVDVGHRTCDTRNPYNVVKSGVAISHFLVGLQPSGHLTLNADLTNRAEGSGIGCTLDLKITGFTFTGPTPGGSISKVEGSCFALDGTCQATTVVNWSINFPGTVRIRITYDLVVSTNMNDNPRHSVGNVDYGDPSVPGMQLPPAGAGVPLPAPVPDPTEG